MPLRTKVSFVSDLFVFAAALVLVVLLLYPVLVYYNRRVNRVGAALPQGTWSMPCVDPKASRGWRVLVADDSGVYVTNTSGQRTRSWAWGEIVGVHTGPVRTALVKHPGVILELREGRSVGLLLPSSSTLRYPSRTAEQAAADLSSRHSTATSPRG